MQWIVWYADGSSITSEEAAPGDVPRWGVLCITVRSAEHGRILWVGKDYFWWDEDQVWVNGDFTGLLDYLTRPGTEKIVLIGRGAAATRFHAVCKAALEDTRLPAKTSTDWLEQTEA
jgi:hypothetical protein